MELVSNLSQFIVTLLGFCLSGIWYLKSRAQAYFLLTCFYGCFALVKPNNPNAFQFPLIF